MPDKWYTKVRLEPADGLVIPAEGSAEQNTGTFLDDEGLTLKNNGNSNVVLTRNNGGQMTFNDDNGNVKLQLDKSGITLDGELITSKSDLIGPAGPAGAAGQNGLAGAAGEAGATGPAGQDGATGQTGATGATGPQGAIGPAGAQGPAVATVLPWKITLAQWSILLLVWTVQ